MAMVEIKAGDLRRCASILDAAGEKDMSEKLSRLAVREPWPGERHEADDREVLRLADAGGYWLFHALTEKDIAAEMEAAGLACTREDARLLAADDEFRWHFEEAVSPSSPDCGAAAAHAALILATEHSIKRARRG